LVRRPRIDCQGLLGGNPLPHADAADRKEAQD
jgi:hypothetical protein